MPQRCPWCKDPLEIAYHDTEWGFPEHDDAKLFEMLILEGMQAGLSWVLILRRREAMRKAFDGFDAHKIAAYTDEKKRELLANPTVIRNRAKINALVTNAQQFLRLQKEQGSFDAYIWRFVDGVPLQNHWASHEEVPATSAVSDTMSAALKKEGFKFVGSTICYSFMQATGMVNDHLAGCDFYEKARAAAQGGSL